MFHMPMSSPMMTTMLGFGCAEAGAAVSATAVNSATRMSQALRVYPIPCLLAVRRLVAIARRLAQEEPEIVRDADKLGPLGPEFPQHAHPLPIGELQVRQIQDQLCLELRAHAHEF